MSYLGFPRLHFSGLFQADASTVNNDPSHFNDDTFTANDQQFGKGATNGWWNPNGTAYWRLRNCRVQSLYYRDGSYCAEPVVDPIIGLFLQGAHDRVGAKIVDLDPEQQMVSEIWGLQIRLGDLGQPNSFEGEFKVAPFSDIWTRNPSGKPDSYFSAVYQSVLTGVKWNTDVTSRFLQELAQDGTYPDTLSIKFTVDGFDDDVTSSTFTWGRIVGTIGPYMLDEPKHFVNGRLLRITTPSSPMNYAPCYIDTDRSSLVVDFGNSFPTGTPGGVLQDIGPLQMAILSTNAQPVLLGPINYLYNDFNEIKAGIQSFRLTPKQLNLAQKAPLAVVQLNGDELPNVYLSENQAGAFARTDEFVYRIDANTTQKVTLYATKFGCPEPGVSFNLVFDNSFVQGQQTQGPVAGPPPGTPESALTFPSQVTTDANGQAIFELTGGAPNRPRDYIDGQVYGVAYHWKGIPDDQYNRNSANLLSVLLWDDYQVEGQPTWLKDVQPIFQQYANLYPVMKSIVDLSSYLSVIKRLDMLKLVFSLDPHDPNYMPVTRDLSGPKRAMIQTWLKHPFYMRITNVEELKAALQTAIELEHSTIPTYLTALYSLKPGRNREVAQIIRSIVVEEMLHMSLACNLLNAIGGSPQINTPNFVPQYPTHLPGGVRPELTVSLKKCSLEHIRDVFMSIEEPEETIEGELSLEDLAAIPHKHHKLTIGWFYNHIAKAFESLNKDQDIFVGERSRQLQKWPFPPGELIIVKDLDSAVHAINEIVEQGEGSSLTNPDDPDSELAHYYKFSEIVHGRRLVREPNGFSFTGVPISFDETGVWPMIDNPDTQALHPDSRARRLSEEFDQAYSNVLNALHTTFNGEPEHIQAAVGLMFSLTVLAESLMQTPTRHASEVNAGPSFQYHPTSTARNTLPKSQTLPTKQGKTSKSILLKGKGPSN